MNDISKKTKHGMIWNAMEKISVQGLSFVLNIILARLLSPNDYGTLGLLMVFLSFSNVFIESGFTRALIQKKDRTEADFSTVFHFNFFLAIFLYVLLFVLSPFISDFLNDSSLISYQRVFFLVVIFNSISVVHLAKLQVCINFRRIALINFIGILISGTVGIIAAMNGLGVWSLIIQSLIRSIIVALLLWITDRWIPKSKFSWNSFRQLFGFGSKLLVSGLLATTISNITNLFIGKAYNSSALGYYTRAIQFPELTTGTLSSVLSNSTFPLMASLQNRIDDLLAAFKKLIQITSLIIFPSMLGLALVSKPLIYVLLGDKWIFSADLLFWLALSYVFTPLSVLNMNLLNAIGRSDLFLKVDLVKIPVIFLTMIITFPISLKAVAIGRFISAFIYFYINTFMTKKLFDVGAAAQLLSSWKSLVATFLMGVSVFLVTKLYLSDIVVLSIGIITGVFVYTAVLLMLREEIIVRLIKRIINR